MKLICEKEALKVAVSNSLRLISTRSTLPVLQTIYLQAEKDTLLLRATDLEQTLDSQLQADISENGSVAVPAKVLGDYLQNNSDETINLELQDTTLVVTSANHKAKIKSLPAEEYPNPPEFKQKNSIKLSSSQLIQALERITFSTAQDDTRPILTGVLFSFEGKKLTIVATDGYRLALEELEQKEVVTGNYIIPRKALLELMRLAGSDEVIFELGDTQLRIIVGQTRITSRLLDGAYPNYRGILPKSHKVKFTVSSASLLQSLRLASIFSRDSAYSTKIEQVNGKLKITATSAILGENTNELTIEATESFNLSVNAQYLIDALQVLKGDVVVSVIDQNSPLVITLPTESSYLYLVMPLRNG